MFALKNGAAALALALISTPAMAASFVTDSIDSPSSQWQGKDWWGVQVGASTTVNQLLTFNIASDSKVDFYIQGSPKFQFTDVLLNGQSIASAFTVDGNAALKASGYALAGPVSVLFKADYTCKDCNGDWFGGYVQVTKADIPAAATAAVPEPATWAMMIAGFALVGGALRRPKARIGQPRVRFA